MAPTITTGLKPLSLVVFKVILQPSFIQQLHKVTFPIKLEQFCLFSALPIFNERPQQFWRRHYNNWGWAVPIASAEFAKGPQATLCF